MTSQQQIDAAAAYEEAGITAAKATMYDLAVLAREEHPTAKVVTLSESDQGSWLWVDGVETEESDEEELEEDDGLASCLYSDVYTLRELYSQYDVRGEIEYSRRQGIASFRMDVAKVLAECAPLPISETSDSTEVTVWSLLVSTGDRSPVVTVHASEDDCVEFFREYYDSDGEGVDLDFNDLADSLNIRWEIDSHIVTLPQVDRLSTPGKTYDHDAAPDSLPGPGDTCKRCGEDITWMGPSLSDWLHVDDKENR